MPWVDEQERLTLEARLQVAKSWGGLPRTKGNWAKTETWAFWAGRWHWSLPNRARPSAV